MTLHVSTATLQEMVAKSIKGASNNKMIPITSLMAISVKDSKLTITTTDATNILMVSKKVEDAEDFYVVVPVDIFSKLVAKTTSDTMALVVKDNCLEVRGNGQYSIELPLDENGGLIKFPEYKFDESIPKTTINLSIIKAVLTANKAALAETMEMPCLTGYYCEDGEVISTDSFKVCENKVTVFQHPVLIPSEVMDLLALMDAEKIDVQQADGKILFTTDNVKVYGSELEGIQDYPVDAIKDYVNTPFESCCEVPKESILRVLDRLALFISAYDKNGLNLTFTSNGLVISSKRSNGTETIKYISASDFTEFTCCADIELLRSQVTAIADETIKLWFGHDKAIKITSGNITQVIALLEDEPEDN